MVSSLVRDRQNVPWGPRQRRIYQRVLSGLNRARALGSRLRILTLTSSPESMQGIALSKNWQVLRKRIERRFGCTLEYYRLRTLEGHGVLHIIYRGPYISQRWLSNAWNNVHKAKIVYIQALRGKSKPMARYLVGRYLGGHDYFSRGSWSWGWVFRGFVSVWKRVVGSSVDMSTAIRSWNILMRVRNPLEYWKSHRKTKKWGISVSLLPLEAYY